MLAATGSSLELPLVPESRPAPAHRVWKKWNPFSDLFLWLRKQIQNGKTPGWSSYHPGAWLRCGISISGFHRHRAPCSLITQRVWKALSVSSHGTPSALSTWAQLSGDSPHAPCLATGGEKSFVRRTSSRKGLISHWEGSWGILLCCFVSSFMHFYALLCLFLSPYS